MGYVEQVRGQETGVTSTKKKSHKGVSEEVRMDPLHEFNKRVDKYGFGSEGRTRWKVLTGPVVKSREDVQMW